MRGFWHRTHCYQWLTSEQELLIVSAVKSFQQHPLFWKMQTDWITRAVIYDWLVAILKPKKMKPSERQLRILIAVGSIAHLLETLK